MFGWFNNRLHTPVEKRNYSLLYAGLAFVLFLGTFWAVYNEIDSRRPWKDYQQQYKQLKERVLKFQMREAVSEVDKAEFKKIRQEIARINKQLNSPEITAIQTKVDDLDMEIRNVSQERANLKSEADNRNYLFEHSLRLGHAEQAEGYKAERTALEEEMARYDKEIDSLKALRNGLIEEHIMPLTEARVAQETTRDSIYKKIADLRRVLDESNEDPIEIKQVMLVDFDRSNFGRYQMRVDRCQSCHLGAVDPVMADTSIFTEVGPGKVFRTAEAAEKMRKVFGPHPMPDLLLTHSVENFGCTSCHEGQANTVDDVEHAHGIQAHWERPMLTGKFVEASCRKCHGGRYTYPEMKTISEGRKLFVDLGCYGCHEAPDIPDWKEFKVGPSLVNISKKVTPEWAFNWIKHPDKMNSTTRMPNFMLSDEETEAVVAYLWDAARNSTYSPETSVIPAGDPTRGHQVFREVGCIACHTAGEFQRLGDFEYVQNEDEDVLWPNAALHGVRVAEGNAFGPALNTVGSKVTAEWLYDWVRNPKHYNESTRMPDLRLTNQEAADLTAFLSGKKRSEPMPGASLSHLEDPKWIERGKSVIREYGCFGCHEIDGMQDEGKVSVSLSDFGRKAGSDLYFGYLGYDDLTSVRNHFNENGFKLGTAHTYIDEGEDWYTWTVLKMKNSRIYETDAIPQKMPVFNMTDEEAYALAVLLRSQTKWHIPEGYTNIGGVLQPALDDGRFLTRWYNCVGCHTIENYGGYVLTQLREVTGQEGDNVLPYGPPSLNTLGAKLQEHWFYSFVNNPADHPVRTWLDIRMPTYGFTPAQITSIEDYFLALEKEELEFTNYSSHPATTESIAAGKQLFEVLKCQQCHPVGSSPANGGATAVPAPNLNLAGSRLKPNWIPQWVGDPQIIVPGSKMPNFFGTHDKPLAASPDILGGDRGAQLNALRDYVWRLGGAKGGVTNERQTTTQADTSGVMARAHTPETRDATMLARQ